jgi:hypothetical protein
MVRRSQQQKIFIDKPVRVLVPEGSGWLEQIRTVSPSNERPHRHTCAGVMLMYGTQLKGCVGHVLPVAVIYISNCVAGIDDRIR